VWVITPLLIAGVENIRNSWYKGLAYTVNQFAIQTPARLFNTGAETFSIIGGIRYGLRAFRDVFNLFIGVPNTYPTYSEYDISEKTQSALKVLLFQELQEDPNHPEVYKSKEDPSLVFRMSPWIHFNKTSRRLEAVFNGVQNSWAGERRALGKSLYEKYVAELPLIENETEGARNDRLKAVKTRVADELVERNTELVFNKVRSVFNENKEDAEMIIQHLLAVRTIYMATSEVDAELQQKTTQFRENLIKNNPIRSRIRSWVEGKVNKELERLNAEYKWAVHERALKVFDEKGWKQQAFLTRFFLHKVRDQKFQEAVEKELKKLTQPTHTFHWRRIIWRPKNWIIKRQSDVSPYYYAEKTEVTETNTKQWFWVWRNYFKRISTWWNNSLVLLVYSMLNCAYYSAIIFPVNA
jgi:hypothetical protein